MESNTTTLVKVATFSRLCIFILQLIFNLAPDHDADAFNPEVPDQSQGLLDSLIRNSLDGFFKWDAKYFLQIARNGYEEERMFAFFPLFPALLRYCAMATWYLLPLSIHSSLLLSGAVLNTAFFVGATRALHELTYAIYKKQDFAFVTGLLFCFNPASIFFSSSYTESLYSYCVFSGLNCLERTSHVKSALFFLAASATRSNGTVNAGFIAYYSVRSLLRMTLNSKPNRDIETAHSVTEVMRTVFTCVLTIFTTFAPFVVFNIYGYQKFCAERNVRPEWCGRSIPVIYSHVQAHHWDVGFMHYFKLIKLPNFVLAVPCQVLVGYAAFMYLKANKSQVKSLGLLGKKEVGQLQKLEFMSRDVFVYVVHALFLILFALFFMHVEVTTRFLLSSSPFPYWAAASFLSADFGRSSVYITSITPMLMLSIRQQLWKSMTSVSRVILLYFAAYIFVGTMLHVNYLPWT